MAKILITGAEGFVGLNLAKALLKAGYQIKGTDLVERKNFPASQQFIQGNLNDKSFSDSLLDDVDGVIHLAGVSRAGEGRRDPVACAQANVMASVNICQGICGQQRKMWLILGSTREVDQLQKQAAAESLNDFYAISKQAMEDMASSFAQEGCFPVLIMRLSDVYGVDNDHQGKLLPNFVKLAKAGETLEVRNNSILFYYTHILDVIDAFLDGIASFENNPAPIEIRRIWSDEGISIQGLAELVCKATSSASKISLSITDDGQESNRKKLTKSDTSGGLWSFEPKIDLAAGIKSML
ncbi:MAG: NAD(P)-dependent oxidoreductase [Magnetococcales bacterium]|nr:NAD(P)-dependent oxidoreductase [Magnetococcales bacterium]